MVELQYADYNNGERALSSNFNDRPGMNYLLSDKPTTRQTEKIMPRH